MKLNPVLLIVCIALSTAAPTNAAVEAAAQAKAAKGPVQITLRLHGTKVKVGKSLWYKLELKNIGKTKMLVDDWTFKDPWGMHENCRKRYFTYLEVIGPDGKPLMVKRGGGMVTWDYVRESGPSLKFTPEEYKEIDAMRADWKKRGLSEQDQSIALSRWNVEINDKRQRAELADPTKQLWLKPGASTTTATWAYRDPSEYADRSFEEAQVEDYTQLWSYLLYRPGTYRIRAVYDRDIGAANRKEAVADGVKIPSWSVKVKTPFIQFEVVP